VQQLSNHALRTGALATLLLMLVAFFVHYLRSFSYLPGADAYFYALQAQSLLLEGHLKVPDHGAFCYVIAALARSGLSVEGAFRVALTLVFSVYQLGMFLVVLRVEKQSQMAAALLWALTSPFVAFHAIEFPNLTMGLATVPFWFWLAHGAFCYVIAALARGGLSIEGAFRAALTIVFSVYQLGMFLVVLRVEKQSQMAAALLWALSSPFIAFHATEFPNLTMGLATVPVWFWLATKPMRKWTLWLALLLATAVLVHPAAAAIAALFAATLMVGAARDGRRSYLLTPPMILAGCVGLLVVTAVIYAGSKARLLALNPGTPGLAGLMITSEVPLELKLTVLFLWSLLALLVFFYWRTCCGKWRFMAVAVLLLPFWPDSTAGLMGVGGRLSALAVLIALPLIIVMVMVMGDELRESSGLLRWLDGAWSQRTVALAAAIAVVAAPVRVRAYGQLLMSDDYAAYEQVVASLRPVQVPMLIAHRGLDFFYSYRLRRDAFHFDPEPNWKRAEIWRVAVRITPEEVAYYSPTTCPWGETARLIPGTDYLLVREDCWEQLRARLNRNDNPDLYMEVWENMENPAQSRPAFLRGRHGDSGGAFAPKD